MRLAVPRIKRTGQAVIHPAAEPSAELMHDRKTVISPLMKHNPTAHKHRILERIEQLATLPNTFARIGTVNTDAPSVAQILPRIPAVIFLPVFQSILRIIPRSGILRFCERKMDQGIVSRKY
jgi:hypothetical protein